MKKISIIMGALLTLCLVAFGISAGAASASGKCVPVPDTTTVVHHPAVTHTVHHPAVTHTIHHDAIPAGPDLWWNWSPNHDQGPFEGPPAFPTDSRGTWQGPHENGGPSQDTYGTFQQGNGHGSWFHREHGTPAVPAWDEVVVDKPAYDETVVDKPAYDETIVTEGHGCPNEPKPPVVIIHKPAVVTPPVTIIKKTAVPTVIDAGL